MPTIQFSTDYRLASGVSLSFDAGPAFEAIASAGVAQPSLVIAGAVTISALNVTPSTLQNSGTQVAFVQGPGLGAVTIEPGGSVRLTTNGYGLGYGQISDGSFINHGVFEITGGLAFGVSAGSVLNTGDLRAIATFTTATGVLANTRASIVNTGLIEARGALAFGSTGVFLTAGGSVDNRGTIRASDMSTSPAVASIAVVLNASTPPEPFNNSGLIEGDVALRVQTGDPAGVAGVYTNSGVMRGLIDFRGGGRAEFQNSGTIDGQVLLSPGNDTFAGASGVVSGPLDAGAGADSVVSGAGPDTVSGNAGADTINGGAGRNYLRGDDGDDSIVGGADFDDINGNMGNDTCVSGGGDDWVVGGKDNDSLVGSSGANLVYGNIGADTCDGGAGADVVRGGQDNDVVMGGAGDDFVSGDKGDDTMTGGAGADVFHTFGDAAIDRVTDFNLAQGDRVQLDPGTQFTVSQLGADTIINMTGGAQMILVGVAMSSLTPGWIFGA